MLCCCRSKQGDEPKFKRTKLLCLGVDLVKITDPDTLRIVSQCKDVDNAMGVVGDGPDDFKKLPCLFRCFFGNSRFYTPKYKGWFIPFRSETRSKSYPPCRAYLDRHMNDDAFVSEVDNSEAVTTAVSLLMGYQTKNIPTDRELSDVSIQAIWAYMVPADHPPIPKEHLEAALKQVADIGQAFIPWKYFAAKKGTAGIYDYAEETLRETGEDKLPGDATACLAHVLFALSLNGPPLLREIGQHPHDSLEDIVTRVAPTKSTLRMVTTKSTLDGILPEDDPAIPGQTMIQLGISEAAQESKDMIFAFSGGPGQRTCAAKSVIMKFLSDVQLELVSRIG